MSPTVLWEGAKCVLRGNIIAICSRLKKERIAEQLELENKIRVLKREFQTTRKDDFLDKLKETRQQLHNLLTYKAERQLRFTNQKYYET